MTFDEWFEIQPHPAMSEQEIAEMRRDYKYAWDAALKHARPEVERNSIIEECAKAIAYAGWRERDAHHYSAGNLAMETIRALKSPQPQRGE